MLFWEVTFALFIISFLWAAVSLRKELSRPKELKKAKKEFMREKILYKR